MMRYVPPNTLEELIENWSEALAGYGTLRDFAKNTTVERVFNVQNLQELPFVVRYAEGYAQREKLMATQKKEAQLRRGQLPLWPHDGSLDCFLCDNVGQAKVRGDNLVFSWDTSKDCVVLPNKYPSMTGHMLLVCKKHDDSKFKVPQIVSPHYLEQMMDLCNTYVLKAVRNHAKAGMSIPNHEHTHLSPLRVKEKSGAEISLCSLDYAELVPTLFGRSIYRLKESRFDTLCFSSEDIVDVSLKVMEKLERDNVIFTYIYTPHKFYLTPHNTTVKQDKRRQYGGGGSGTYGWVGMKKEEMTFEKCMNVGKRFHPLKGTFCWEKYF